MGIDVLIRAWPEVLAARPDARLVIVGSGREERALGAQVEAAGLDGSVSFEGCATDERLIQLYSRAALTVVPSVELEGFGLIALESLAAGRAPIVTDCGGLPDSVRGLDATLIVSPGDASALAGRIARALDGDVPGPDRCRTHAEAFSWDAAAERHVAMYRELLG
jgi:glycosyltransferase involved in cell wall biosynthesis